MHDAAPLPHAVPLPFSWRRDVALWAGMILALTVSNILTGWYNGRGTRPWMLAALRGWFTTAMIVGARRRWKLARDGTSSGRRFQVSMAEFLLLATGSVAFVGFTAAEHRASSRVFRERERVSALAAPILGPAGRLGYEPNGDITISICDRTFDDDRLDKLASLISQEMKDAPAVTRLMFGSRPNSNGAPRWPGVTDRSVEVILRWNRLEWLFIYGTAISADGCQELKTLPALNEHSLKQL
jgi:hypothetical protein